MRDLVGLHQCVEPLHEVTARLAKVATPQFTCVRIGGLFQILSWPLLDRLDEAIKVRADTQSREIIEEALDP